MITGINESKILTKDVSCECKCRFDGRGGNSDHWWNTLCFFYKNTLYKNIEAQIVPKNKNKLRTS